MHSGQVYAGPTIFVAIFYLLHVVDRHTGMLVADTLLAFVGIPSGARVSGEARSQPLSRGDCSLG